MSQIYEIEEIEYERQSIKKYDVLFWHRLLRTIYQEPSEIECALYVTNKCNKSPVINLRRLEENSEWKILNTSKETALKIQSGKIKPIPINWKYFISLSDSGIIVVGTKDQNTVLYFAHILSGQVKNEDREQAKKFISLLLDEAKKVGNQLFNPIEEFKKNDNLKLYHLFNVYRANYVSAEFMLSEALTQEKVFRKEIPEYDARATDPDEEKHIDQYFILCGTYFLSAIIYFFISLEGFINIVFHSYLKKTLETVT